jgi:hypothetical protein
MNYKLIVDELDNIKNSIENLMRMEFDLKLDNKCLLDTLAKLHCCLDKKDGKCQKCFKEKI